MSCCEVDLWMCNFVRDQTTQTPVFDCSTGDPTTGCIARDMSKKIFTIKSAVSTRGPTTFRDFEVKKWTSDLWLFAVSEDPINNITLKVCKFQTKQFNQWFSVWFGLARFRNFINPFTKPYGQVLVSPTPMIALAMDAHCAFSVNLSGGLVFYCSTVAECTKRVGMRGTLRAKCFEVLESWYTCAKCSAPRCARNQCFPSDCRLDLAFPWETATNMCTKFHVWRWS